MQTCFLKIQIGTCLLDTKQLAKEIAKLEFDGGDDFARIVI